MSSTATNTKTNATVMSTALTPLVDTVRMIPQIGQTRFSRFTLLKVESHRIDPAKQDFLTTKTPATFVKEVMASIPVAHAALTSGIRCHKVTNRGLLHHRVLTISNDRFALFITHHKVRGTQQGNGVLSSMASKLPLPFVSRKGVRGFGSGDLRDRYVRYVDVSEISFIHEGFPCTRKMEYTRTKNGFKGKKSLIDFEKEQIVSIVFRGNETLDVLIPNANHRKALVQTLKVMMQRYHDAKYYVVDEARLLRYIWYDVDINQDGLVSEGEFVNILNRINISVKNARQLYQQHKHELRIKEKNLTYRECMKLLHGLEEGKYDDRYSVQSFQLWDQFFGKVEYVSAEDFLVKFLHAYQKEMDTSINDVCRLLDVVNKMEVNRDESILPVRQDCISKTRFKNYLHHSFNAAFDPDQQELNRDVMDRPLTEYWINTSHNTYLTGDQLQSASSVECYAGALRRGCKCLELDCYDGEKNSVTKAPIPIVYHGGTFTSKLLFEDIVEAVKSYMEGNPDTYPIILSLENHCSKPFQQEMAKILRDFLGDHLYKPDKKSDMEDMASPESLRGKVIIKGKRPPEKDEGTEEVKPGPEKNPPELNKVNTNPTLKTNESATNPTKTSASKASAIPEPPKIVNELAALTLFHGIKFKNFQESLKVPIFHMHSIGETKLSSILSKSSTNADLWRRYNARHLTRTYPAGARVDSSNYDPLLAWSLGCQLVALNFQTNDTPLLINDGRFFQNGKVGYVLKPSCVIAGGAVQRLQPVRLMVRVLSGSCLPKPGGYKVGECIDPYVKISVHDVQTRGGKDTISTESALTETIYDNGYCPNWNEESFHTFEVYSPDVAMIHFTVMESDLGRDERICHAVMPLNCMRQGYRSVQLYDKYGTRSGAFGFATLLVEIKIK